MHITVNTSCSLPYHILFYTSPEKYEKNVNTKTSAIPSDLEHFLRLIFHNSKATFLFTTCNIANMNFTAPGGYSSDDHSLKMQDTEIAS